MVNLILTNDCEEYLSSLTPKQRSKMQAIMGYLKEQGHMLRMPHCKNLTGRKIWELRAKYGNQFLRVFYFFYGHNCYLLNGFMKDTDETSKEEIERALRLKDLVLKELN